MWESLVTLTAQGFVAEVHMGDQNTCWVAVPWRPTVYAKGLCPALMALAGLIWGAGDAAAQVAVQPPADVSRLVAEATAARQRAWMPVPKLEAMQPGDVQGSLAADLARYDWLIVGAVKHPEGTPTLDYASAKPCQLELRRYLPNGGELVFAVGDLCTAPALAQLTHRNFDWPPPMTIHVQGTGRNTWWHVRGLGQSEVHRVVAYRDGVLILDISRTGKKVRGPMWFREVRVALAPTFVWQPGPAGGK